MSEQKEKKLIGIAIVTMVIVVLVLSAVLVIGVRGAGGEQGATPSSLRDFLAARRLRGPLPLSDASLIRSWMTFDYVNQLFDLPEGYLKTDLSINDPRYPNLAISEYKESLSTSTAAFLSAVRSAILDSTTTPQ